MGETKKLEDVLEKINRHRNNCGFKGYDRDDQAQLLRNHVALVATLRKAIEQRDEHRSGSRVNEQIDAIERDNEQLRKILDGEEGGGK